MTQRIPPTEPVTRSDAPASVSLIRRIVWLPIGALCVLIGSIGIVVPGLPSTIFFIGAAGAFSRSSPRLERWVLELRWVGPMVRDYRAGLGMPRSAKITAVSMLVAAVAVSTMTLDGPLARTLVLIAGGIGTGVILHVPTRVRGSR